MHENYGKAAPAPTFEDMLKTAYDDELFDYYFTSQVAAYRRRPPAQKTAIGKPAIIESVAASPNGEYFWSRR